LLLPLRKLCRHHADASQLGGQFAATR
jgi:hypothetical protein